MGLGRTSGNVRVIFGARDIPAKMEQYVLMYQNPHVRIAQSAFVNSF